MGTGYTRADTANNIADGNIINASDLDGEFDAVQSAFDASTGHTHDGTAGEGAPIETIGPSQDVVATASVLRPKTDNTVDLGTTSLEYKDLFLDGTAHIDTLDVDENASITGTLGVTGATTLSSTLGVTGATTLSSTLGVTGAATLSSTLGVTGAATLSSTLAVTGATGIDGDFDINTNKFTVASATGNTAVAGTLGVTGATTATGGLNVDTISEITSANGVVIDGVTLKDGGAAVTADITFGDGDKAIFGAGSDLQIYHSGSNSHITEGGTGNLIIRADDFRVQSNAGEEYIAADANGAVSLRYDNANKLATTSTGIDVTGTVTADGLTVDGNNNIQINRDGVSSAKVFWNRGSTQDAAIELNASEDLSISVDDAALGGKHLNLLNNNKLGFRLSDGGDISFYEDTGTTAKFFWDASAESLGIGTSSPYADLHVTGTIKVATGNAQGILALGEGNGSTVNVGVWRGAANAPTTDGNYLNLGGYEGMVFATGAAAIGSQTRRMVITDGGNVGIGTDSPDAKLDILGASSDQIRLRTAETEHFAIGRNASTGYLDFYGSQTGYTGYTFGGIDGEHMRIDSSGNVGIGTSSPSAALDIKTGTGNLQLGVVGSASGQVIATNTLRLGAGAATSDPIQFYTSGSEAMRIDSSGNLLVGKTVTTLNTQGTVLYGGGAGQFTVPSNISMYLNRTGSDGDIVQFSKSGSTVGSIGTDSDMLVIGSSTTNLNFRTDFSTPRIIPRSGVGSSSDGIIDLGDTGSRFKDLYLSGGVYLGGTGAANKLDDYEEGTFTPSVIDVSGTPLSGFTYSGQDGSYTKVGNTVHLRVVMGTTGTPSGTDPLYINLPFAVSNAGNYAYGAAAPLVRAVTFADNQYLVFETSKGTSRAAVLKVTSGTTTPSVLMNDLGSAFNLNIAISYQTDA